MKKPIKIYGPPGTGKTFRLIRRVNAYVRTGTPYHKIGYFAFTKKAAKEARERIGVDEKQVPYFQTLHAFCFHLLNSALNYFGLKCEKNNSYYLFVKISVLKKEKEKFVP